MKANLPTIDTPDTPHDRAGAGRHLTIRRTIAVALVAVLGAAACESDPGPSRVARDIVEAESEKNPELDEQCLLDVLDSPEYSNAELEAIGDGVNAGDAGAEEALAKYQASLEACL